MEKRVSRASCASHLSVAVFSLARRDYTSRTYVPVQVQPVTAWGEPAGEYRQCAAQMTCRARATFLVSELLP